MPISEELIDIKEVAETLGKSVESIRKYKNFGIIRVTDKRGNKDLFDKDEILKIRERLREHVPVGFVGEPLDIAHAVMYLASDAARFVTGIMLPVDGGTTAR